MRKILLLFVICSFAFQSIIARPRDRHVYLDTICNCTATRFQQTLDRFFYQFQTGNTDSLFTWVYLNTNGDGDTKDGGKDAIGLRYTYATYNPITKTGDQALDIYVLGSRMFPNRHIISVNHGSYLTATYSGSILDDASIVFRLDSVAPQKTHIHYEFNLIFGRFIAMFISDKTWNGAIQWRLEQIFYNLMEYAETGKVIEWKKKNQSTQ